MFKCCFRVWIGFLDSKKKKRLTLNILLHKDSKEKKKSKTGMEMLLDEEMHEHYKWQKKKSEF